MAIKTASIIYFGPVAAQPSWEWVGADIARHIGMSRQVRYFDDIADICDGATVFWIKNPGTHVDAKTIRQKRLCVLFFPVDAFQDEAHILAHSHFIQQARLVCLHSHSLAPYFAGSRQAFVNHYNKYGVNQCERRPDMKTLLWIGAFQYVPFVLDGLQDAQWPLEDVILMTNLDCARARDAADRNAVRIGMKNFRKKLTDGKFSVRRWSEDDQRDALLTCSAAFDSKYLACFNQFHKPPTKLQKYLSSGVPCAVSDGAPFAEQVKHTVRFDQLLSIRNDPAYLSALQSYSVKLAQSLSLSTVADSYLMLAESVSEMSQ
jgi:hypothetical protein